MGCKQSCLNNSLEHKEDEIEQSPNNNQSILENDQLGKNKQQKLQYNFQQSSNGDLNQISISSKAIQYNQEGTLKDDILKFFRNQLRINANGQQNIEEILNDEYTIFQISSTVYQWLFPNFLSDDLILNIQDQQQILTDYEIAQRYLKGYLKILEFFGLQIMDELSGSLAINHTDRFNKIKSDPLICKQIRRILASLSVLGFRKYAREFCRVLNQNLEGQFIIFNLQNVENEYIQNFQDYDQYTESLEQETFFKAIFSDQRYPMVLNQESIMLHIH